MICKAKQKCIKNRNRERSFRIEEARAGNRGNAMATRNTYFEDEKIEKKIDLKQLRRTLAYILPYKRLLALVSCMMLVAAVVSLLPPRLLKLVVDEVVANQDYRQLALVSGGLALLAAAEILSSFVQARSMGKMGLSIITKIRTDIFERLQLLSFDYFDNRPDGKIVVRVTEYINGLADFFSNYVMMFAIYIVKLVVVTVFMLSLSPMLTLIVFASVVPMMAIIFRLRSRLRKMYAAHRAKNSNRTAFLVESIMGEQIVKNYNRIEINKDIYRQIHEESVDMWWNIVKRPCGTAVLAYRDIVYFRCCPGADSGRGCGNHRGGSDHFYQLYGRVPGPSGAAVHHYPGAGPGELQPGAGFRHHRLSCRYSG